VSTYVVWGLGYFFVCEEVRVNGVTLCDLHIIYCEFRNSTPTNTFHVFSVLGNSDLDIDAAVIIGSA